MQRQGPRRTGYVEDAHSVKEHASAVEEPWRLKQVTISVGVQQQQEQHSRGVAVSLFVVSSSLLFSSLQDHVNSKQLAPFPHANTHTSICSARRACLPRLPPSKHDDAKNNKCKGEETVHSPRSQLHLPGSWRSGSGEMVSNNKHWGVAGCASSPAGRVSEGW